MRKIVVLLHVCGGIATVVEEEEDCEELDSSLPFVVGTTSASRFRFPRITLFEC